MKLKISLVQLAFEFGNVDENFRRAAPQIAEASARGTDLVLLPELWASGFDLPNWAQYATALNDGSFARLGNLACGHHITLGSSLLELDRGCIYNTFALFGADGSLLGSYRKIHRFRLLQEEKYLGSGNRLGLINTPWGPTGLSICYDLRFPEMFRQYALDGARLLLNVAEWPEQRIEHWRTLLRARAIENQAFVAAVNKVGESQGIKLGGRSAVISPTGEMLVEGGDSGALLTVEIDLSEADKARRFIPVLRDRRPDVY